jgi:type IV secretory pathway TrbL component
VRKLLPLTAVLALGMAGPLSAQVTVSGAQITNGANTNAATSMVPTVGMTQMLPKLNLSQSVGNPFGGAKSLSFTKMIPSFSSLRSSLWPMRTPSFQMPASSTSTGQKK